MALQPPKWCSHAVPTPRGWVDPRTGELLVSRRFTNVELSSFYDARVPAPEPQPVIEQYQAPAAEVLTEAPPNNKPLGSMTKAELVALAEQSGVVVESRDTKAVLVEKLEGSELD